MCFSYAYAYASVACLLLKINYFKSRRRRLDLAPSNFVYSAMNDHAATLNLPTYARPGYQTLGAHLSHARAHTGVDFAVWAPNAQSVHVTGDFNDWAKPGHSLALDIGNGVWRGFISEARHGDAYQYRIHSRFEKDPRIKADPYACFAQAAPGTASRVWDLSYTWQDAAWMEKRAALQALDRPISVYEVHLGSWRRDPDTPHSVLGYRALAPVLAEYARDLGFTHVELLPIMEHPFYGSWGYQTLSYFAPSARYGTPQDFMYFVDTLHQAGLGVILDWTPAHFPCDAHGLAQFDGTALYEHADPRLGFHPEWKSCVFNYGRREVSEFLTSSALFWLAQYHIDGLRLDAVASMLYLDYARPEGSWIPNATGGKENTEAIAFLRQLNQSIKTHFPDVLSFAEESTAWPAVSRPVERGGLGFDMKWNMGWMHDTLAYFANDPLYRTYRQDQLTFSIWYAFFENFILPLSHDEVVYGKSSLLGKMPGDDWQKRANLRLLLGYMWTHPGKKLLFMGGEFGQIREWNHDAALDWYLLEQGPHQGLQRWVQDLNRAYRAQASLHEMDFSADGYSWVDKQDHQQSVISFLRLNQNGERPILVVCNFTPVPRHNYRIGVPRGGVWTEILNSDATLYGGSGQGNLGAVEAAPVGAHGHFHSLVLTLPPLAMIAFTPPVNLSGTQHA